MGFLSIHEHYSYIYIYIYIPGYGFQYDCKSLYYIYIELRLSCVFCGLDKKHLNYGWIIARFVLIH